MSQAFELLTITNLHYLFYRTPLLGYYLSKSLTRRYVSDYHSTYGFISGLNGPAQAYLFWKYWCDLDLCEKDPQPDPALLRKFAKCLNAIYQKDGRPLLGGWLGHAFYLDQMRRLSDLCVFVRVRRDPLATARSLWVWRKRHDATFSRPHRISARPRAFLAEPGHTPYEQVARQIFLINRRLDEQQQRHSQVVFDADYAETCRDPRGFVSRVAEFLQSRGLQVRRRTDTIIPESFKRRLVHRDDDEHTRQIAEALDVLAKQSREGE